MLIKNVRWKIAFGTVLVAIILEGNEKNKEYIPSPDAHRIDAIGVALKCSGNRDCDTSSGSCACSEFSPAKFPLYECGYEKSDFQKVVHVPREATADENAARDRHFYVRLSVHCNIDISDGHLHEVYFLLSMNIIRGG